MSAPFIFIGSHTIKQGKLEEYRKQLQELVDVVETNEPRLIAFNVYVDEAANKVTGVQIHPDASSMEFHMRLVADHIRGAYDNIKSTDSIQVYGSAPDELLDRMRQTSPPGTPFTVMPVHEVGFTRTSTR